MVQSSGQYKQTSIETQMMYVEAETEKELTRLYLPTPDELDRLARLVSVIYKKISSLNLPDVRHYPEEFSGIAQFEEDLLSGAI